MISPVGFLTKRVDLVTRNGWVLGMKFTPLGDRVLLKIDRAPDRIGLIYVPQSAKQEVSMVAEVVVAGPKSEFSPGDRLVVGKHSGTDLVIGGVSHVVVPADKVLAKVGG